MHTPPPPKKTLCFYILKFLAIVLATEMVCRCCVTGCRGNYDKERYSAYLTKNNISRKENGGGGGRFHEIISPMAQTHFSANIIVPKDMNPSLGMENPVDREL